MDPKKAEYVGVPYQESPPVQVGLDKTFEIPVTVPERGNIDGMWEAVCASIDRAYERHLQNGEPILVIDDGGYASKYICEKYAHVKDVFRVEEQTTRGLTEIAKLQPHFGIANVGGAHGKRFESNQIGDVVVHAVR
jgi:S-adenosylhomocysteine hydrolase